MKQRYVDRNFCGTPSRSSSDHPKEFEPEVLSMFVLRASPVFLGEMNGTATALVRCATCQLGGIQGLIQPILGIPMNGFNCPGRWLHKALALSKAKVWKVAGKFGGWNNGGSSHHPSHLLASHGELPQRQLQNVTRVPITTIPMQQSIPSRMKQPPFTMGFLWISMGFLWISPAFTMGFTMEPLGFRSKLPRIRPPWSWERCSEGRMTSSTVSWLQGRSSQSWAQRLGGLGEFTWMIYHDLSSMSGYLYWENFGFPIWIFKCFPNFSPSIFTLQCLPK